MCKGSKGSGARVLLAFAALWLAAFGGCTNAGGGAGRSAGEARGVSASANASRPTAPALESGEVRWHLDDVATVGGVKTQVLGTPRVVAVEGVPGGKAIEFDGTRDGLILPVVPVAGMKAFTIQVLFRPASGGPAEQRFMHAEDAAGNRFTLETRVADGTWALDTFLLAGPSRLSLYDATKLHPCDQWYWVALRYDGTRMSHFINGVKELEGPVTFGPMGESGRIALGVRLNQVSWFKGEMAEVRFVPRALEEARLEKAK